MQKVENSGLGTAVREEQALYTGAAVEGTDQCLSCERFMSLGDAKLCLGDAGDFEDAAEIVGWVAGECDQFVKAESPFEKREEQL
jgi:hypothetical protein